MRDVLESQLDIGIHLPIWIIKWIVHELSSTHSILVHVYVVPHFAPGV